MTIYFGDFGKIKNIINDIYALAHDSKRRPRMTRDRGQTHVSVVVHRLWLESSVLLPARMLINVVLYAFAILLKWFPHQQKK